jgi:Domain of unknown function (DUF932)
MLPLDLPPEQFAETNDPTELRYLLESDFNVEYRHASLRDIELLTNARLWLKGEELPCTQFFLEAMASEIGMPLPYAYDIDEELFRLNFERRKSVKDAAIQICLVVGRAVGVVAADYRPARTIDLLNAWSSLDLRGWSMQHACVSDRSAEIDLITQNFMLEPQPGDEIRAGIRITNSETGGTGFKASFFTHRLKCSNGAVMSDHLGTVRWTYDRRVTYGASIRKCAANMAHLASRCKRLEPIYAAVMDQRLSEEDFTRLWRRLRSAGDFSPAATDVILGVTTDERRAVAAAVARRRADRQPEQPSPWDLFTTHNRVTAAAKAHPFATRSRLERIGGDLLSPNSFSVSTN